MKRLTLFILCLSLHLSSQAQVNRYLAKKGERVDFDTAMVIKLESYRQDFREQQAQRRLIDSLQYALTQKETETLVARQPAPAQSAEQKSSLKTEQLSKKREGLKWYFNPILYLGAGLLMGVYLVD